MPEAIAKIEIVNKNTVVMSVEDYRTLITEMMKYQENIKSLEQVVAKERASIDDLIVTIKTAEDKHKAEREAADLYIKELEKKLSFKKRSAWIPGIIGGIRPTSDWNVEGVIGIGWKLDLIK